MGCFGCHGTGTFLDEARPKFSFGISFPWKFPSDSLKAEGELPVNCPAPPLCQPILP